MPDRNNTNPVRYAGKKQYEPGPAWQIHKTKYALCPVSLSSAMPDRRVKDALSFNCLAIRKLPCHFIARAFENRTKVHMVNSKNTDRGTFPRSARIAANGTLLSQKCGVNPHQCDLVGNSLGLPTMWRSGLSSLTRSRMKAVKSTSSMKSDGTNFTRLKCSKRS